MEILDETALQFNTMDFFCTDKDKEFYLKGSHDSFGIFQSGVSELKAYWILNQTKFDKNETAFMEKLKRAQHVLFNIYQTYSKFELDEYGQKTISKRLSFANQSQFDLLKYLTRSELDPENDLLVKDF